MIISPCYGCEKRCLLCHAHCDEYAEWVQKQREQTRRPHGDYEADSVLIGQKQRVRAANQARWRERNRR